MDENELKRRSYQAVQQMRAMNLKANSKENNRIHENSFSSKVNPQEKSFKTYNKPETANCSATVSNTAFGGNTVSSLLNSLTKDNDTVLILSLLLILMSEKADKVLLFALIYILF